MDKKESSGNFTPSERRSNQGPLSSNVTDEGCPVVVDESGAVCGETETLSIIKEFREIYEDCVQRMERCKDDSGTLKKLAPFKKLVENLWEQNSMLVETVEELEQEATSKVAMLQQRLHQSSEKDLESILKQKESEIEHLRQEISGKDALLKKYFCQIDELRNDAKAKSTKYKCILRQLKEAAIKQQPSKLPIEFIEKDEFDDCDESGLEEEEEEEEEAVEIKTLLEQVIKQKNDYVEQIEKTESQIKLMQIENNKLIVEKNELVDKLKNLSLENDRLVNETDELERIRLRNQKLEKTVADLKTENKHLLEKATSLNENMKELDNNFKKTRWALTAEIAEKHDQIQEFRRNIGSLEEQLRQADMQTHFKDDIIKELRKDLKNCKKSERRGLYDVVTELKGKSILKNEAGVNTTSNKMDLSKCACANDHQDETKSDFSQTQQNETDKRAEDDSPQVKLERLKKALNERVERIEEQEIVTKELEDKLKKTRRDLTTLKEKYENFEINLNPDSNPEVYLQRLRTLIFCASDRLEKALSNLSANQSCSCSSSLSRDVIEKELEALMTVKEDLHYLQIKQPKIQFSETASNSESLEKAKMEINRLKRTIADMKSDRGQCDLFHVRDLEDFRTKAVTGMAALEEIKEQVDTIQHILKNYYSEIPYGCEKYRIEECEDKIEKLHSEFDEVTDYLCSYIEKVNSLLSGDVSKPCELNFLNEKLKEKESEMNGLRRLLSDYESKGSISENICKLREEQVKLQKEISDRKESAEKLKEVIKEIEKDIELKRCQVTEHDREIKEREEDISRLRDSVKDFRQRLKDMQIDVAEHLKNQDVIRASNSCSSLSNLSYELQELYDVIDKSKDAIPCALEKSKEEVEQMKDQLKCLEKCICNKDETLRLLQDTLKIRETQIEDLNCKTQSSEKQIAKLNQDLEEKCRLITNLQETVRKCKQFEMKLKDDHIESLQFELCDLDVKLKVTNKEVVEKEQKMEFLLDEIIALRSRNFFLTQEIEFMEPKLRNTMKNCDLFEKMVKNLEKELATRECEIESLYEKVKELEEELEDELRRCEERAREDSDCMSELNETIEKLQNELRCVRHGYDVALAETERQLIKERDLACEKQHEFNRLLKNYKCAATKLQQTLKRLKNAEDKLSDDLKKKMGEVAEAELEKDCYEALLDERNAECSEYITRLQTLKTEFEIQQVRNLEIQGHKDCEIETLKCNIRKLEHELKTIHINYKRLEEDYGRTQCELLRSVEREANVQKEFTEKEKEMCFSLKSAYKDEFLTQMNDLQKRLEEMRLEIGIKEQRNDELTKELALLRQQASIKNDSAELDENSKNQTESIICQLKQEVKTLQRELDRLRSDYNALCEDHKNSLEKLKMSEKRKANIEKLYNEMNIENAELIEARERLQDEICRLQSENVMLKEKVISASESRKSLADEKKKYCAKIKELNATIKTLETRVISELQQEICAKDKIIESIKMELREANLSTQRMRSEALRVVDNTKRCLAAQKCANEALRSRLENSGDRKHGESRELDEQLKAVTRMNEFLLCELQNQKMEDFDAEPRSFSPLPWGCSAVERDASSEYLIESGFQSMQPSPTDLVYDLKEFTEELKKTNSQWNHLRRHVCAESE